MKLLRNIPVHSLLVAPLFIFFLFVHNYSLVKIIDAYRSLLLCTLFSIVLFVAFYFIFRRNQHKAGVFQTILLLFLFSYGLIYDILETLYYKGLWPMAHIHRYLLLFLTTIIGFVFIYTFRTKRAYYALTLPLNIFVFILYAINAVQLAFVYNPKDIFPQNTNVFLSVEARDSLKNLPDIYYIILDGYANDKTLSAFYNYPQNTLTKFLKENNFFVAEDSRTNYPATAESLGSSLNLNYLDSIDPDNDENIIYSNQVCRHLKSKGYRIVHMRSGYTVTRYNYLADTTIVLDNISEFERALLRYTIFRLDDLSGYLHYDRLQSQLKKMFSLIDMESPKFVFIHIVSPHPPFICDETGKYKPGINLTHVWWEPREDYVKQLRYINSAIEEFLTRMIGTSPSIPPVIILQSDHGPWMQDNVENNIYEARSLILNAYYGPDDFINMLYPDITPVNSFRLLFNGLFDDSFAILSDIPVDSAALKNSVVFQKLHP